MLLKKESPALGVAILSAGPVPVVSPRQQKPPAHYLAEPKCNATFIFDLISGHGRAFRCCMKLEKLIEQIQLADCYQVNCGPILTECSVTSPTGDKESAIIWFNIPDEEGSIDEIYFTEGELMRSIIEGNDIVFRHDSEGQSHIQRISLYMLTPCQID